MDYLTIHPDWKEALAQAGLADLDALLAFSDGQCLSRHLRGKTSRTTLPGGQTIFIKQDHFTKWKTTARNLVRFRKPQPNTEMERQRLALVASYGITVPEVIAWGQRRRFGLPHQAVMVMLPMDGIPLPEFLEQEKDPEKRKSVIAQAEETLHFLQENALDWLTDCKPEHFFVLRNGKIGLIDLERLHQRKKPLSDKTRKMQLNRFRSLLPTLENIE
jgi:predicted Ser/Thr protein kinase